MGRAKFHKAPRREQRQQQTKSQDLIIAQGFIERARQVNQNARHYTPGEVAAAAEVAATSEILSEGRTKAKTLELAQNALSFAQGHIDRALQRSPADYQPACQAGCAFCCALPVEVSALEALYIAHYLNDTLSSEERGEFLARLRQPVEERRGWAMDERWARKRFCTFLRDDWQCGIYPIRPLSCRGYSSLSWSTCEDAFAGQVDQVRVHGLVQDSATGVMEGLMEATTALGLEWEKYELESAVLRALEVPDAAERWVRGERVFVGCDRLPMPGRLVEKLVEFNRRE
jgi:Fe-S-cluster containining protein